MALKDAFKRLRVIKTVGSLFSAILALKGKGEKAEMAEMAKRRKLIINITFVISKVVDVYKVIDRKS